MVLVGKSLAMGFEQLFSSPDRVKNFVSYFAMSAYQLPSPTEQGELSPCLTLLFLKQQNVVLFNSITRAH